MKKKNTRNTKGRIVNAAWKLFYQQGYEETTVEDIVYESGTSKGSFYHYFDSKDALLSSLSFLFDEKYESLMATLDNNLHCADKLLYLTKELFQMIENSISLDLLARLLSSQLVTKNDRHLLDHNRTYYRLLREIIADGLEKGELKSQVTINEMVRTYSMLERSLMFDWCLCNGEYSLAENAAKLIPLYLESCRA